MLQAKVDTQTGGEALVEHLRKEDVDTIFLIPGVQLDWAVDALARASDIRMFVPRHEQAVSYMADGYARVSGKTGVGMVVPGPGLLNAGAGLSTAYACNTPMVMIVGHIHSSSIGKGFGNLHELRSQSDVLKAIVKSNHLVTDRAALGGTVTRAFGDAREGRNGPVSVEVPFNLLIETAPAESMVDATANQRKSRLDMALVDQAAEMLNGAEFPIAYIGGGTRTARPELKALAEHLNIPVIGSENARGCLPDSHPMSFTALEGRPLFEKADVVLVIGSRFMEAMAPEPSWPQKDKRWIYVNIDPADFSYPREPDIAIKGDAAAFGQAILTRLAPRKVLSLDQSARIKTWAQDQIGVLGDIAEYSRAMRRALPEDGIFVNELTQVGYLARIAFRVEDPSCYIGPGYQGTLGYSYPTALGAAVGGNGRRVYAITGDGGLGWSCSELATAMRYNLPVTVIVFNDGYYGNVRAIQQRTFGREAVVELRNPNFELLAAAYDMPFARAGNPEELESVLRDLNRTQGPSFVEVPVGLLASPWPLLRLKPMPGTGNAQSQGSGLI